MKKLSSEIHNQDDTNILPQLLWDKLIATNSLRIRQSLHLPTILQMVVDEVHQLMQCDRILLYQFEPDWTGRVMVEAISAPQWTLLNRVVRDTCFETSGLKTYQENQFNAIADVTKAVALSPCYINFLNQFQIKANLIIPVLSESKLWGLLVAHHCTEPHEWLPEEINGLEQIAVHLGISIYQAELIESLQLTKASLESQVECRISELQIANQKLSENAVTNQALIGAVPDFLVIMRRDGMQTKVLNHGVIHCLHPANGIGDGIGGSYVTDIMPLAIAQERIRLADIAISTGQVQRQEYTFIDQGETYYEEARIAPLNDNDVLVAVSDITDRKRSEIALKQSESRFLEISESSPSVIYIYVRRLDGSIYFEHVSRAIEDILGVSAEQILRDAAILLDRIHPEDRDDYAAKVQLSQATLQPFQHEWRMITTLGEIKWVKGSSRPKQRANGEIAWSGVVIDIGVRKQAELDQEKSEDKYRNLIENLHAGFVLHAADTSIILCNAKASNLLGLSLDQMMGKTSIDPSWHFSREDGTVMPLAEYPVNLVVSTGKPLINYVLKINRSDRTNVWVLVNAFPEFDLNKQLQQIAITFIDISDRKKAEAELEHVSERLAISLKSGAIGCWDWDINENIILWDDRMYELYGVKKQSDSVVYDVWANGVHPEDRSYTEKLLQKAVLGQAEYDVEFRVIHPDHSIHFIKAYGVVVRDVHGNPQSMIGINFDVSDRKQAELSLQESESRFQKIALSSPGGIYILARNLDGLIYFEYVSSAFESIFEITVKQALDDFNNYKNLIHPDDLAGYHKAVNYSNENLSPFNHKWRIITPTKKVKWVQARSRPEYRDNGTMAWHGVVVDITDQIESEQRLNQLAENIPGMIYQYRLRPDGSSCFPYSSNGIYEIYNLTPEQLKEDASAIFQTIHPDDLELVTKSIMESATKLTPWQCEYRVCVNDRTSWIFSRSIPQKELDGSIIWHGYMSDMSDRKQTEIALAKAKEDAEAATKAKGEFLANMSHEIRTPMNGVLGMAELLADTNLSEEQQDFVKTIQDSGDTLLVIINDILDFSKIESGMLKLEEHSFVLKDVITFVCNLLNKASSKKQVAIAYVISTDIPTEVIGDSSRLRQILLNLVGNAVKFTQNGNVNISVSGRKTANNEYLELFFTIQDNGSGIDRDRIDKLFQPFTQADASISRKYGGTGLGLAISKSLVKLMGGTIWVESMGNIGGSPAADWIAASTIKGSSFYFTAVLKVVPEAQTTSQIDVKDPQSNENTNQSQLKILLAEDNSFNQKVATMMLKKLGYTVDIANNGLEVLAMLEKQFYDIILMDMQMPEMDGITATKIIRQTNQPQPWIIALTANALEEDRQICLDAGMNDFVTKPIPAKEFNRIISKYSQINLNS